MSDHRDTEIAGAKRVIAAMVKKYGPFEITVAELVSVDSDPGTLSIGNTVDGYTYRYEAAPTGGEADR